MSNALYEEIEKLKGEVEKERTENRLARDDIRCLAEKRDALEDELGQTQQERATALTNLRRAREALKEIVEYEGHPHVFRVARDALAALSSPAPEAKVCDEEHPAGETPETVATVATRINDLLVQHGGRFDGGVEWEKGVLEVARAILASIPSRASAEKGCDTAPPARETEDPGTTLLERATTQLVRHVPWFSTRDECKRTAATIVNAALDDAVKAVEALPSWKQHNGCEEKPAVFVSAAITAINWKRKP